MPWAPRGPSSSAVLAAHRDHRVGALLLVDLDGFKAINDSMGHGCGDQVLVQVGQRLAGLARAKDTAARLRGDEFALVLNAVTSPHAAMEVAHRAILDMVAPIPLDNGEHVFVGVSIGVAVFHGDVAEALPTLIERADRALYASKREGKGRATLARSPDRQVCATPPLRNQPAS
jgi:diguanylate cyclase